MTEFTADYTGRLRSDGNGGVVGWIVDRLGARVVLTGVRDPHGGGYLLSGEVQIPEFLKQPAIDMEE
jgi:hypothetical protein